MATVIRMRRGGRTHKPYYRIVVQDSRDREQGADIDVIGYHHPIGRPKPVSEVNVHKALDWLQKGAQVSDTVRSVLSKTGVLKHFHDGTRPDEPIAVLTGERVEQKGYNAPPPAPPEPVAVEETAPETAAPETVEAGSTDEAGVPHEDPAVNEAEAEADTASPITDGE